MNFVTAKLTSICGISVRESRGTLRQEEISQFQAL